MIKVVAEFALSWAKDTRKPIIRILTMVETCPFWDSTCLTDTNVILLSYLLLNNMINKDFVSFQKKGIFPPKKSFVILISIHKEKIFSYSWHPSIPFWMPSIYRFAGSLPDLSRSSPEIHLCRLKNFLWSCSSTATLHCHRSLLSLSWQIPVAVKRRRAP